MTQNKRFGRAVRGYIDPDGAHYLLKVSVGWTREQVEAINRRVVVNNTTFACEARRLVQIGLELDHVHHDEPLRHAV